MKYDYYENEFISFIHGHVWVRAVIVVIAMTACFVVGAVIGALSLLCYMGG